MRKLIYIFLILLVFPCNIYANGNFPNLLSIGHISPKGRIQDKEYNKNNPIIDELLGMGKSAIPFLINRLGSKAPLKRGVLDYWPYAEERHLALGILTDLFLDQTWKKSTVPNLCYAAIVEAKKYPGLAAWDIIYDHFDDNKWNALQQQWLSIWENNKDKIFWDSEGRFFRIEGVELKSCEE